MNNGQTGSYRPGVLRLVMRGAFAPVILGLLIGIPVALLAARLIADQLFKVRPYDPLSIALLWLCCRSPRHWQGLSRAVAPPASIRCRR